MRSHTLLLWCMAAAAAAFVLVGVTGFGVDVLVVVLLCCGVVAVERTLGDWLSDLVGSVLASVIFAGLLGAGVWVLFAEGGKADQFYAAAEKHGYHTLYGSTAPPADPDAPSGQPDIASPSAKPAPDLPASTRAEDARPLPQRTRSSRDAGERGVWSLGRVPSNQRQEPIPVIRLEVPELAAAGSRLSIHARVSVGDQPLGGASVEFTIDGRQAGTAITNASGIASTVFTPPLPRTYQVEARLMRTGIRRPPTARALLYVLSSRSS